jgi:hypothetical protein
MDENTSSVNVQGYGDLYIVKSGTATNVTIEKSWYVGNVPYGSGKKIRVIICSGVTLKIPTNDAGNLQSNVEYYVAPGGSLTCDTFIKLNGTNLFVAQGGSVSGASFETTEGSGASSLFYNMGTATFTGDVNIQKYISTVVNDGTLTAANLRTQGSGKFQNNGDVTIKGKTIVNSNGNTWVNNGFYHTGDFEFTAKSSSVINNCKLFVDDSFFMNCSDGSSIFQMDGGATSGASVVTKYFYGGGVYEGGFNGGPYRIEMGSKSLFKVTETAYLNATGVGTVTNGYGFFGVGNDFAVFQAKTITNAGNPGHGYVAYGGKLYVSAESHFAQGTEGASDGCSYICFFDGDKNQVGIYAPGFLEGLPNFSIRPTNCNPGFNYTEEQHDTWKVRVMAEDLSATEASDFDFNDVVFDVVYTEGQSTATITLRAAGGTLPLRINSTDGEGGFEVHDKFGGYPTTTIINTGWTRSNGANDVAPATETISFSATDEGTFLAAVKAIRIEVRKTNASTGDYQWYEMTAEEGEPASKFAIPLEDPTVVNWCSEQTSIKGEYEYFADWARTGSLEFKWW